MQPPAPTFSLSIRIPAKSNKLCTRFNAFYENPITWEWEQVCSWGVLHKTFQLPAQISFSTSLMCLLYVIEVVSLRCRKLPTHFAVIECLNCLVILYIRNRYLTKYLHNVELRHISIDIPYLRFWIVFCLNFKSIILKKQQCLSKFLSLFSFNSNCVV